MVAQIHSIFHSVCKKGHLDVVKVFLKRIDISDDENYGLRLACENGHIDIIKELLNDSRVDPSDNYNEIIINACIRGYVEVVKVLLQDSRVNPSDQKNKAIQNACHHRHTEIVRLLLSHPRIVKPNNIPLVNYIISEDTYKREIWHKICQIYKISDDLEINLESWCFIYKTSKNKRSKMYHGMDNVRYFYYIF